MPVLAGLHLDTVRLARLDFYPVLLGPKMRMAFVRVGESRITYVWRGVRWSAARTIGGRGIYLRASFPDDEADGSNLVVTFGWHEGAPNGYQIRLRFDGEGVLPVAKALRSAIRRGATNWPISSIARTTTTIRRPGMTSRG